MKFSARLLIIGLALVVLAVGCGQSAAPAPAQPPDLPARTSSAYRSFR